jgi:hypothetical protein
LPSDLAVKKSKKLGHWSKLVTDQFGHANALSNKQLAKLVTESGREREAKKSGLKRSVLWLNR